MLEKPDLPDERLAACLSAEYGQQIRELTFLPLGADLNTAVYRAVTADGTSYFVKLRSGDFDGTAVRVPQQLRAAGIEPVIAPIRTLTGALWTQVQTFTIVLYPFIDGENGFDRALGDQQWKTLGQALRQLHTTQLPDDLAGTIHRETYSPYWRDTVCMFQSRVAQESFNDPSAAQLATMLHDKREIVSRVVERAGQLAVEIQERQPDLVLCHGDIHAGNVLIDRDETFYIVDWDTLIMAPKERDLMFIGAGIGDVWNNERAERLFYRGYGEVEIAPVALAYYRFERIVQDIAEFANQLLLTDEGGDDRPRAVRYFASQFESNGILDIAWRSDPLQGPDLNQHRFQN